MGYINIYIGGAGHNIYIYIYGPQGWPDDLPLISGETGELDLVVVLYSCSFAVMFLMILSQVIMCEERLNLKDIYLQGLYIYNHFRFADFLPL